MERNSKQIRWKRLDKNPCAIQQWLYKGIKTDAYVDEGEIRLIGG